MIAQNVFSTRCEYLLHPAQVLFRIDSHGIEWRFGYMYRDAVIEEAELFEAFGALQCRFGPGTEGVKRGLAVGVEAEVLEVRNGAGFLAIEGNRCPREVEPFAVERGHDLYGVGIRNVF